jgi:hypothetical protein
MGRATPEIPEGMRGVHRCFARWRRSHNGRLPIPEFLWRAVAEVAREHGVFRTANVLSLDYGKLSRQAFSDRPSLHVNHRNRRHGAQVYSLNPLAEATS